MTIRVAQITDIHLTSKTGSLLYGVDPAVALENTISRIRQLSDKPDLVIVTGDLAEDGSKDTYKRLRKILLSIEIPTYVLPGNHDDVSNMHTYLEGNEIFFTKAVDLGDWVVLFINSQVEGHSHGYVSASEIAEIERCITKFADRAVLVALHHTPSNVCPTSICKLANAEEFTELLNSFTNVKAVIAGHTHNEFEFNAGGHIQFTTPSTFLHVAHAQVGESVDHEDIDASHNLDGSMQGFRTLELFPDGRIQSEVHWLEHK